MPGGEGEGDGEGEDNERRWRVDLGEGEAAAEERREWPTGDLCLPARLVGEGLPRGGLLPVGDDDDGDASSPLRSRDLRCRMDDDCWGCW